MFNKDAMGNVKSKIVKDEVVKVVEELAPAVVEEVNRAGSTGCFGWKISLQLTRQTPSPAPATLVASESKSPESPPQSKAESV
jgi:hypothetical protein